MRVLILADVHSNLEALQAVRADAHTGGYDEVWCLGDVVGYGPDPEACLDALTGPDCTVVAGNHDYAVAGKLDLREFNQPAAEACLWTAHQLTPHRLDRLARLPETVVKAPFTLVHGTLRYPLWEYLLSEEAALATFSKLTTPYCLVGHSHVPFVCCETKVGCRFERLREGQPLVMGDERLILNPGSVGQPRDGDPRAAYVIYDSERATLTYHRVRYDVGATQGKMRRLGLPAVLSDRLSFGR